MPIPNIFDFTAPDCHIFLYFQQHLSITSLNLFHRHLLTTSASTVNPCLKGCVIQAAKRIGCWNEGDIPGSIKCGCGDKRSVATQHGVACLQGKCPDQIGGAWGLFDKMCKEGITGNINYRAPRSVHPSPP